MELRSDQIATRDELGRVSFADTISSNIFSYLTNNEDALVVGLYGPWGSGKSTLLSFLKNRLVDLFNQHNEKSTSVKGKQGASRFEFGILEFNPWAFSGKEELHAIFLNELASAVGNKKQKIRNSINAITKKLEAASGLHVIGKVATDAALNLSKVSIDSLKKETNDLIVSRGVKTVVIIDDLDRLPPNEILELFQLVKLNANFKNTVFIISFDKSVVVSSIENQYKLSGEKYLEKIIQVDYTIPSILPEELESIFFSRLSELVSVYKIDFDVNAMNSPWVVDGLGSFFQNVRDINRYFNSVSFRLPPISQDIDVRDFLLLEAIRLFDYESYELIESKYLASKRHSDKSIFSDLLDKISIRKAGRLFKVLFPEAGGPYITGEYRIANLEFFNRYFSLALSKKDVHEEEVRNFVQHPSMRISILRNSIESNNKVQFLLRRLSVPSVLPGNAFSSGMIGPLISVWDDFPEQFVANRLALWQAIKSIAFGHDDPIESFRSLIAEFNVSSGRLSPARFFFAWLVLESMNSENEKRDRDLSSIQDLIVSEKTALDASFKSYLNQYQNYFFFDNSYSSFFHGVFFPGFARYFPREYAERFQSLLQGDKKVFSLLNIVVHRDSRTSEPFGINSNALKILFPRELHTSFVDKLKQINPRLLSDMDAETIKYYLKYIEQKRS